MKRHRVVGGAARGAQRVVEGGAQRFGDFARVDVKVDIDLGRGDIHAKERITCVATHRLRTLGTLDRRLNDATGSDARKHPRSAGTAQHGVVEQRLQGGERAGGGQSRPRGG